MTSNSSSIALVAFRDREQFIIQALKSASDFTSVLAWDDGSTDFSYEIASVYAGLSSLRPDRPRVSVQSHLLSGQMAAKAGLLREAIAAGAETVCFLDSDDYRLPGTLDRQLALIRAGADVAIAPVIRDSDRSLIQSPANPWFMLYQANFASVGVVFRASAIASVVDQWESCNEHPFDSAPELQFMANILFDGGLFAWSPTPVAVCRDRWSPNQAHTRSGPVRRHIQQQLLAHAPDTIREGLLALPAEVTEVTEDA
jgi:glycosyltransferase involved in cell wall biosynthesis